MTSLILGHLGHFLIVTDKVLISFKEFLFEGDCVDHLRPFVVDTRQGVSLVGSIVTNETVFRSDLEIVCIEVALLTFIAWISDL